jgi:hypothetical protein
MRSARESPERVRVGRRVSIYKSEGWASTLLMIGPGILIGRSYWLVEGDRGWTERRKKLGP